MSCDAINKSMSLIANFFIYADDFDIGCTSMDILRQCKNILLEWASLNALCLEEDKTVVTRFGGRKRDSSQSSVTKLLGLHTDSELMFDQSVRSMRQKASVALMKLVRLRSVISSDDAKKYFYAFVLPYLEYGLVVLHCFASSRSLSLLDRVQDRFSKIFRPSTPLMLLSHRRFVGFGSWLYKLHVLKRGSVIIQNLLIGDGLSGDRRSSRLVQQRHHHQIHGFELKRDHLANAMRLKSALEWFNKLPSSLADQGLSLQAFKCALVM
jgi:hypothetical protein